MTRLWTPRTAWTLTLLGICASAAAGQEPRSEQHAGQPADKQTAQGSALPLAAEDSGAVTPAAPVPSVCHGEIINRIDVHAYPPFENSGDGFSARMARIATGFHAVTRVSVIRRYIPFRVGDRCVDYRLREAERILRAQPFIADANLIVVPDSRGGVDIDVVTFDEVSLVFDGSVTSKSPIVRAVRFGENNLAGAALSATVAWQNRQFYRDVWRARVVDYQLFGRPYQLSVQGTRGEIGGSWDVLVSHPFITDLQRTSWRASAGSASGFLYFVRPGAVAAALPFVREYSDAGGLVGFGPVKHIFLIGATLSRERERTGRTPVLVLDSAVVPDTSTALIGRYVEHRSSRVNLLLGFRNVKYLQVRSFDAVEGTQDVRTGVQLSTLFGRGLKLTDKDERDYIMSTDLYLGRGTEASFTGLEIMGERRRDMDTHKTDGVLATGRAAWYAHPGSKHTSIFDLEYSGGWKQRVPFQVTLADREGGMPGYRSSHLGGAQRMVLRMEDRYRLGHFRQFASLAGALWLDAGKLWAGEAPFGVTTNVKYSAGIGLLAALPPRSRRTWRVDLAFPLNDRGDSKFEIRITNHDFTRWFWREPGDVQTSRERSIPNSVFNWP